jgi:hypothetical protein
VNSSTRKRMNHVLVAGLTAGILAGLAMPLVESAAATTEPPGSEPAEPPDTSVDVGDVSSTTTAPAETTVAVEAASTAPATTVPPPTLAPTTVAPATTPATTAPVTTGPTTTESAPVDAGPPIAPTAVPSAPTWLSPIVGGGDVTLFWTVPADGGSPILDYIVEQRAGDSTEWTIVADAVDPNNIASATGLVAGTPYHFRVHAVNQDGPGPTSDELTVTPRRPPDPVRALTAAPTSAAGQVRLEWTAPAFDGGAPISDYIVQHTVDPEHSWNNVVDEVGTSTSAVVGGLARCTRYYFRVLPVNDAGPNQASAVVVHADPVSVPTAPGPLTAAPTNSSGQVRLTWSAPACDGATAITDYVIQHAPIGSATWTTINDGMSTATAYTVTGLVNGTGYYFRVYARNAVGQSPPSGLTSAIPRAVPTVPRSLTATATGASGQIRLAWVAPVSNGGMPITDYVIYRSTNGTTGWVGVSDGVNANTAYTVTGLVNGTRYYFKVYARNAVGPSAPSNLANAIPRNVLTAPRSLVATPTNVSGQVRLSWTVPLSNGGRAITDYVIQRSANGSTGWVTITDGVNTATAYTVTGLANGARYYFRVLARTGTITGPASNVANAIPWTKPTPPRSPAAAPTNLSGQVRLTWLAPASNGGSAVSDYVIQRSTNGTTWTSLSDGVNTATTYLVPGLSNGTRYYFRVFARNAVGYSAASPAVSAIPRTVPSQPAFVRVVASFQGFALDWGAPPSTGGSPITGYVIQAFNFDTNTWVTLGVAPATWRSVFIDAPGEGCGSFRIAARNAAGQSPFLGPVTDCWP